MFKFAFVLSSCVCEATKLDATQSIVLFVSMQKDVARLDVVMYVAMLVYGFEGT